MNERPQPSALFSASDADVVFISSDGVLFNLHRRNLEITTGAFPPTEFTTADDVVPLTEPSAVLELLFQFAYPQQYPDIFLIKPFELFAALAEAAEKYEVYPAINARYTSTHPKSHAHKDHAHVLAYASRHGHMDLADIAAPLTVGLAQAAVVALLSPVAILPYLKYVAAWNDVFRKGCQILAEKNKHRCSTNAIVLVLTRLGAGLFSLSNLSVVFNNVDSTGCRLCSDLCDRSHRLLEKMVEEIPNFSTFFTR